MVFISISKYDTKEQNYRLSTNLFTNILNEKPPQIQFATAFTLFYTHL